MKKIYLFLLLSLPIYILINMYFLDRAHFLCPIEYKGDFIIRCDAMGEGFFASQRSGNRIHEGIDLLADMGSPVSAARAGRVIAANLSRGMGKYIAIRHAEDTLTLYGHLCEVYVKENQFVRQGELIGRIGKTGNAGHPAIQPHLHFEVRRYGIAQDPLEYL